MGSVTLWPFPETWKFQRNAIHLFRYRVFLFYKFYISYG